MRTEPTIRASDKTNIFIAFFLQRDVLCMRASILWRILPAHKSSQVASKKLINDSEDQ